MKKMITEFDKIYNKEGEVLKGKYKVTKRSTLMNASRSAIYVYLCHHPCSPVSLIAKRLKISESSVRWHLDKLVFERFVTVKDNGNTLYLPTNMIPPEHIYLFRVLSLERTDAILSLIISKPGLNQSEVCKKLGLNIRTVMKYTSDLEKLGLIRSSNDGKYKYFYPTNLSDRLSDFYRKRAKDFKEYVLKRTKQDGLRPKILLSTPDFLKLKLIMGKQKKVLTVPMNPFYRNTDRLGMGGYRRYDGKKPLISLTGA